jgi:hypothetical protein
MRRGEYFVSSGEVLIPSYSVQETGIAPRLSRTSIPFNAEGKGWVRFAVWDSAGSGAVVQPIKLTSVAATAAR